MIELTHFTDDLRNVRITKSQERKKLDNNKLTGFNVINRKLSCEDFETFF